jgi:hypothetical protein
MKNFSGFDDVDVDENENERRKRRRKTKDETASIEKEQKKEKYFQNKRACVRAPRSRRLTYLAIQPAERRAVRQRSTTMSLQRERVINYRKCPNFDERTNERT